MKVNNEFDLKVEGGNLIVTQKIIKTLSIEESMAELDKLRSEFAAVSKDKFELQKYIDDNVAESKLEALQENITTLKKLQDDWHDITEPFLEELKKKFKRSVKQEKVKRGYNRETDLNKKVVLRANILGHLSDAFNLNQSHPIVQEIRHSFDKI